VKWREVTHLFVHGCSTMQIHGVYSIINKFSDFCAYMNSEHTYHLLTFYFLLAQLSWLFPSLFSVHTDLHEHMH